MNKNPHQVKLFLIFPPTDAPKTYLAIQQVHNIVNRIGSKKLTQWGLSVPNMTLFANFTTMKSSSYSG